MLKKRQGNIVYTNYSPYENSGKILDYLLENFTHVFHFSIGFHNLKNKKNYNRLLIFKNGKLKKEIKLFQLPVPQSLVFILLPIRSIINFLQVVGYTMWLKKKYRKIDIYFTVNAFIAWIGNLLRSLDVVEKTVFWVWDYYPPIHENKIIMLLRYIYWQFDKISSYSDKIAFVNHRLLNLRKDLGIYDRDVSHPIIPIATDKIPYRKKNGIKKVIFAFIGVLKRNQGPGIVFEHSQELKKHIKNFSYEVIGSGPDEGFLKNAAKETRVPTKFYGYMEGESFNHILDKCTIGIATYIPDSSNVSYYGDPGKIKRYICLGLPVIGTDVLEFSEEIAKSKAGVIVDYDDSKAFVAATKKIMANYSFYSKNAHRLSQKYYYKKIYPEMFDFAKP